MTEHFSFFDAIQDSNGHYDREYNAQQFTDYFKSLVTTGVMKGAYNQLEVTTNGANMESSVKSGIAFVEGRYYYNDSLLELTHDTEVVGLSRIDRIVIRLDLNTENRYVRAFVKKGTPSSNPVAPTLTRNPTIYEISLAQVKIIGGQTYINTADVIDERGNKEFCPWAGSKILPNFNDDALEELVNKVDTTSNTVEQLNVNKANKVQENWILATLQSPWSGEFKYFKDQFGIVFIQVIATKTTNVSAGDVIFTLPVGYRPSSNVISTFIGYSGSGVSGNTLGIEIATSGTVKVIYPATTKEVAGVISFRAS